jgi:hypothetical protein
MTWLSVEIKVNHKSFLLSAPFRDAEGQHDISDCVGISGGHLPAFRSAVSTSFRAFLTMVCRVFLTDGSTSLAKLCTHPADFCDGVATTSQGGSGKPAGGGAVHIGADTICHFSNV